MGSSYFINIIKVAATALTILDEVCDDKMYLESLVATKSVLFSTSGREARERLGDRGRLLLTRYKKAFQMSKSTHKNPRRIAEIAEPLLFFAALAYQLIC